MKLFSFPRLNSPARLAVATVAALCLSACDDKPADEAKTAEQSAETPAETPAEQPAEKAEQPEEQAAPVSLTDSKEALFNQALFVMAQKVTSPELFPEVNSEVKTMLEMLETYYTALCKENGDAAERARVALMIAKTTRDLSAYAKAQAAYERALADIEAAPKDDYAKSAALSGIGSCLLAQNKAEEALTWYEKALAVDEELYKAVAPAEGETVEGDEVPAPLAKAAANLLDSYRCMGDCQNFNGDPEGALTTYKKGQDVINAIKKLSPDMSVSFVKLLTVMGNLENANGKSKEALGAWVMAARICQALNANSPRLDIKAETKRCHDGLVPAIQSVAKKLQDEQDANGETTDAAAEATADIAQTEPLAPLPEATPAPAPEPAAAPAPAPAPVKPQPAKQNNKRRR